MGFFQKLKAGLTKTRQNLLSKVENVILQKKIDVNTIDEIEEALIASDVGAVVAEGITANLKKKVLDGTIKTPEALKQALQAEMADLLGTASYPLIPFGAKPFVIMVVGVNGVGKTTTIGKLASKFTSDGYTVLLAAADTFRAAAIEQLEIWANRAGADIVKHQSGSDPAAVAFDAVEAAKARGTDIVIVDTAGRLHTKFQLMDELSKVTRVIKKSMPDAPQEIILVLDATTGQNAIRQALVFKEAVGLTGIALTKLDGSAKGGVVFSVKKELGIPVRLIGVGEGIDDMRDFDPQSFAKALFEVQND